MDRRITNSITGGEDVTDARLICIKGSGASYVSSSKIAQWWTQLQGRLAALDEGATLTTPSEDDRARWALVAPLPRAGTDLEMFLALARVNKVLNNFPMSASQTATEQAYGLYIEPLWRPDEIKEAILARHPDITANEFELSVVDAGAIDEKTVRRPSGFGEYLEWLGRVVHYAEAYEPFYEKAFEIWRRGRDALVSP